MKTPLLVILVVALLLSCADPAEEMKAKQMQLQADSLRAEIRATQARIDSLKQEAAENRRTMDSLGIPIGP